ncbi:MAG TPA: hypothetical protein VKS79_08670 [Gemmataceae bacterium]|nr:hypothetical protein [Gemmataceae bacterium]
MTQKPCAFFFVLAIGSLLGPSNALFAGSPRDELLRLTPPEVTFCLCVQDLRDHVQEWKNSPFWENFPSTRLGKVVLDSAEYKRLQDLKEQLSKVLGEPITRVRDDMFGDAIVIAYQAGPPGKPEEERGLLLTWLRDPKLAEQCFARLNETQKQSGELKEIQSEEYHGLTCIHRAKSQGQDEYYCLHGNILMFSAQKPMLHKVVDLWASQLSVERATPFLAKEFDRLGLDKSIAALWLNPRSFDTELSQKLKAAKDNEASFLAAFQQVWQVVDGIGLSLSIEKNFECKLVISAQRDKLPQKMRGFPAVTTASSLWQSFPPDALLAIAGHTDFAVILEALGQFVSPEHRKSIHDSMEQNLGGVIGKDLLPLLPKHLGPEWGVCLTAPTSGSVTPEFLFALQVRPSPEPNQVEQAVEDALDTVSTLLRFTYNASHAEPLRQKVLQDGKVRIKYLVQEQAFPPGFQPAFALKDGFLMIASTPAAIQHFQTKAATEPSSSVEIPLLRISLRQWDAYLQQSQAAVAKFLAAKNQAPEAEVHQQIDKLRMLLELLDHFEIVNQSQKPGQLVLAARLKFRAAWKK